MPATHPSSPQPKFSWSRTWMLIFSSKYHLSTKLPVQEQHCGLCQSHLPTNSFLSNLNCDCTKPTAPIINPLFLPWERSLMLPPGSLQNLPSAKLLTTVSLQLGLNSLVISSENTSLSRFHQSWVPCGVPLKAFTVLPYLLFLFFRNHRQPSPDLLFPVTILSAPLLLNLTSSTP